MSVEVDHKFIHRALFKVQKRAETIDRDVLTQTFVDVGPLAAALDTNNSQVLFGRRGTGKTHVLSFIAGERDDAGDLTIYIDMRKIGSSGGMYNDPATPLAERATRLLVDTLLSIHGQILAYVQENSKTFDLSKFVPLLDVLATDVTEVRISGDVSEEKTNRRGSKKDSANQIALELSAKPKLSFADKSASEVDRSESSKITRSGKAVHRVHFGSLGNTFAELLKILSPKRIFVILDEWSVVPLELQPYLADLIRRALLPHKGVVVKIGAIEQRSLFQIGTANDYIGLELGSDVFADVNLDDFMVFNNNDTAAQQFFGELMLRHINAAFGLMKTTFKFKDAKAFISKTFTQSNAFDELVRAAEGVPRDAINIMNVAALRAGNEALSILDVRTAAKAWYNRDKEAAVNANPKAQGLLHWIIDVVIGKRLSKAFLLRTTVNDDLIDALFDARVLHVLKRNIASNDQPGVRYNVFGIDFGCYVDLQHTSKAPKGLLLTEGDVNYVNVPPDDYRSIRRAILNLQDFYQMPSLHSNESSL